MVTLSEHQRTMLGRVVQTGSLAGVGVSFTALMLLVVLGERVDGWPFFLQSWWEGSFPLLRFLAGAGLLVLLALPIATMLVIGGIVARARSRRHLVTVIGLFLVLAGALALGLLGR
jgi:hypothetical protein